LNQNNYVRLKPVAKMLKLYAALLSKPLHNYFGFLHNYFGLQ